MNNNDHNVKIQNSNPNSNQQNLLKNLAVSQDLKFTDKQLAISQIFQNQIQHTQKFVISPKYDSYKELIGNNRNLKNLQQINWKFNQQKIFYHRQFKSLLKINFDYAFKSRTLKIMEFICKISFFSFFVKILNLTYEEQIMFEFQNLINEGAFASVYRLKLNDKEYAVKSIPLVKPLSKTIEYAVREMMIMKICSVFQISPPFYDLKGFHMITTQQNIFFACQKGISIEDFLSNICQSEEEIDEKFQKLKHKLALLHKLSITHNDIKPDNIVYSPSLNEFVFIDFGLSEVNEQEIGFMKMQSARGSLNFCCQQMKKLLTSDVQRGYVDVYYNDIYGLKKTYHLIKQYFRSKNLQRNVFYSNLKIFNFNGQQKVPRNLIKLDSNFDKKSKNILYQAFLNQPRYLQMNKEVVKGHMIYFISLVSNLDLKEFCKFFTEDENVVFLIYTNLYKVYFIFLQIEPSFELYDIYNKLIQYFKEMKLPANNQTQLIINKFLQPYFRAFAEKRQFKKYSAILDKYIQKNEKTNQKLKQRFYSYNVKSIQQSFYCQQLQNKKKFISIQISQQDQFTDTLKKILEHLKSLSFEKILINFLNSLISQIKAEIKWYNLTFEKINTLKNVFLSLKINISFKKSKKINNYYQIFYYVRLLAHILFEIISKFQITKTKTQTDKIEQEQTQSNKITKEQNQITNEQHLKQNSFFQFSNLSRYNLKTLVHKTLIGLSQLSYFGYQGNSFDQLFKFNKKLLETIDYKIYQAMKYERFLKMKKENQNCQNYDVQIKFTRFILSKLFENRYTLTKQTFCRVDQYSDTVGMFDFYQNFLQYGNFLRLFNFEDKELIEREVFPKLQFLNIIMHKENLSEIQIEKQITLIVMGKLLLPPTMYREYGLIKKIQKMIEKIENIRHESSFNNSMLTYLLTLKLSQKITENQIQQALNIIKKISVSNYRIILPSFNFICSDLFKRIHHNYFHDRSKKRMIEVNSSSLLDNEQIKIFDVIDNDQQNKKYQDIEELGQNSAFVEETDNDNPKIIQNNYDQRINQEKKKQKRNYEQAWVKISSKKSTQNDRFRLLNLRNIVQLTMLNLDQQETSIIEDYLKKYSIEQNLAVDKVVLKFDQLKKFKGPIKQIFSYLGFEHSCIEKQEATLQKVKIENILQVKMKNLRDLIYFHELGTQKIAYFILLQWKRLDKYLTSNFIQESDLPLKYMEVKCKVFEIMCNSSYRPKQNNQNFKNQYVQSSFRYFNKIKQKTQKQPCRLNQNHKNPQESKVSQKLTLSIHRQNHKEFKLSPLFNLEIYLQFILNVYEGKIQLTEPFTLFYTQSQISTQTQSYYKSKIQVQLAHIFCQQFSPNRVGKIFTLTKCYRKFLDILINIGSKWIFPHKLKKAQNALQLEFLLQPISKDNFIVFLLSEIVAYINKFPCSSYSSFLLKLLSQVKKIIIAIIKSNIQDCSLIQNIEAIQKFQILLKKQIRNQFILKSQTLIELNIMILNCQQIKFELLKFYITNQTQNLQKNFIQNVQKNFIQNQSQKIIKLIHQSIIYVDDLQFMMKYFLKHEVFRMQLLLHKLINWLKDKCQVGEIVLKKYSFKKMKKLSINYFRSCRKLQRKIAQQNILNLSNPQSYYKVFSGLDEQVTQQIIKNFNFGTLQMRNIVSRLKIQSSLDEKMNRYIMNFK